MQYKNQQLKNFLGKYIDFNKDFFPQTKEIKFTDMLVDNWEERIKPFSEQIKKELIMKAMNYNFSNNK